MCPSKETNKNEFYNQVYQIVRLIPLGKVSTYGAIAKCLGTANSSRMVGYAMNGSHNCHPIVPAHRVVNRNGLLTGKHHFATETEMEELLKAEGVEVENNKVLNFSQVFWDPQKNL